MSESRQIFVAIASYTDPELPRTLRDASAMARHPDALRFGICWQADPATPVRLIRSGAIPASASSIRRSMGARAASGPRNIAQSLWRGAPYTLQVDSHMKFEPAWGARLIEMLERLPSAKPIVTMNAPLFWRDDEPVLHRVARCGAAWPPGGQARTVSPEVAHTPKPYTVTSTS